MKKIFILLFIITGITVTYAQNNTNNTDTVYKYPYEIIISAPRLDIPIKFLPLSGNVTDKDMFRVMPRTIAIDEPLKLVPGVKVDNQANGERVHLSIRGQGILSERGIRGINIIEDGIQLNDPTGFAPDLFDIDWATVDRMEILRGPAASLYGGNSSGGVINIITQNGPTEPIGGRIFGTYGSYNFWKALGQYGGTVDKFNYRMTFSRNMGDGYREHTHFWANKISGKAEYTPNKYIKITPVFFWTDSYHENAEGINLEQYRQDPTQSNSDAIPFNEYLETNRITGGVTMNFNINNEHEILANAFTKRTLFTEANNHTFNNRTIITPGATIQYIYNYGKKKDFIKNSVSAGSDFKWQDIDEFRVDNIYSKRGDTLRSDETIKQSSIGLFLLDKISFGDKITAMLSARYDKIKNELEDKLKAGGVDFSGNADFNKTTGRIGLTYSPLNNLNVYASFGQGFLPPATEELAQNPDGYGGFNKSLVAATSNGFDLGIRGTYKDLIYYDVTGFYLMTENDFDRYRISSRGQETFYKNSGSSNRFGAELYTRIIPVKPFMIQIAYTYSNFKYTNTTPSRIVMDDTSIVKYIEDGNYLPNSPVHQLYVDLKYTLVQGLDISLSSETVSKTYIDGANLEDEAAEGYSLLHGKISYNWRLSSFNGELSFFIKNITDKQYVAFTEPDPGGNAYQPAPRREFFGSLMINF